MAISPNGLIARENGDEDWLPGEGWTEFVDEAHRHNNIVMGRNTYEIVTKTYDDYNFDNVEVDYKLILTKDLTFEAPDGYDVVHGPDEAMRFIEGKGLDVLFLIGGGRLNAEFLKRKYVDEIELCINPYIIGKGKSFIFPTEFDQPLELISCKKISNGRVFLRYRCLHNS